MNRASWTNGRRVVTGSWEYLGSDTFTIWLDERDRTTGEYKLFRVYGDTPEWGRFRLIKEARPAPGKAGGA